MIAATTAIVGVKTAAAHAAITLEARSGPIEESTTTATLAAANTARETMRSRRLATAPVSLIKTGEPTA
jgi:hypothetical protein